MTTIEKLEEYSEYQFSSGGTTGEGYKKFERTFRGYIKNIATKNNLELVKFNKGHYYFSCFIKNPDTGLCVYVSISDVRAFPNEWRDNILIRTADHEKDYRGGQNSFTSLEKLEYTMKRMLKIESVIEIIYVG